MRFFILGALFVLLAVSSPLTAHAEERYPLAPGQILLNISATETIEVEQDLLVANFRIERQGSDPAALQSEVNQIMADALAQAERVESVKVHTAQYYIHQHHRTRVWNASQGLMIKGKDAQDLLDLAGELQADGLLMGGLNYQLSPERREEVRESLLEDVINKLQSRAERTGGALGKSNVEFIELNVDAAGGNIRPVPMARSMVMGAAMDTMAESAPVAAPGTNHIAMTVSATALLSP